MKINVLTKIVIFIKEEFNIYLLGRLYEFDIINDYTPGHLK